MKGKVITILLILLSISNLSFLNLKQNKLEDGFYYLSENSNQSEIVYDYDSETPYRIEKNPILKSADFVNVKSSSKKFESTKNGDYKFVEIKLNKVGRKKWLAINKRIINSGESIVFVFENKVILEKQFIGNDSQDNSSISLLLENSFSEIFRLKLQIEIENNKLFKK